MKNCPICNEVFSDDKEICDVCGYSFKEKNDNERKAEPDKTAKQQLMYQQPMYQQPVYQQPVYQQPAYQQPVYQQPMYQQPMYPQQPMPLYIVETGTIAALSLVFSILSLLMFFLIFVFSVISVVLGLIMALVGLGMYKAENHRANCKSALVLCLFWFIIFVVVLIVGLTTG